MPSFRLKRGNSEKVNQYVGNAGELIYNTETNKVVVMDGVNAGGSSLGGSEIVESTTPPAFDFKTTWAALSPTADSSFDGFGNGVAAVQQNVDTMYFTCGWNTTFSATRKAIYSVSKSDFNAWRAANPTVALGSQGYSEYLPAISTLASFRSYDHELWFTWMDNNGGRGSSPATKYTPFISIAPDSTGAAPVAYLTFQSEVRPNNSSKIGRVFIASGANLENLQELLLPTINSQLSGHPELVDANAGGEFDEDSTGTSNGFVDMDPNFWGSTTKPFMCIGNSTHIFTSIQWWGVNVYDKNGTYVKSLKHPKLGFYNSGWNYRYNANFYDEGGIACNDDYLIRASGYVNYYSHSWFDTGRGAADGTKGKAQNDMLWGELDVYSADGTFIQQFVNPTPKDNDEYNTFAYQMTILNPLTTNGYVVMHSMASDTATNGVGVANGHADGTKLYELGKGYVYDLNTMQMKAEIKNTDPETWGEEWSYADPGYDAFADTDNNDIIILSQPNLTPSYERRIEAFNSSGQLLDRVLDNTPDDIWNTATDRDSWSSYSFPTLLDDKTIFHVNRNWDRPYHAVLYKIHGSNTKKLKVADNQFLKLPTDPTFEVDITKSKLSDFTNDAGFATTSAVPTALSQLTNDVGFSTGGGGGISIQHHLETSTVTLGPNANASYVTVVSHTFTGIPEGATVVITVSGDIFWDSGNSFPSGGFFYFTPDGVRDTAFQRLVWGAHNSQLGLANSTYEITYKPITVTGGSLQMAVEFQQNSDWRARFAQSANQPTYLQALIIG